MTMSTRPGSWGSGAAEMATPIVALPGSVGFAQAHPLTAPSAIITHPSAGHGPDTVPFTHSGVGHRSRSFLPSVRKYFGHFTGPAYAALGIVSPFCSSFLGLRD